MLNLDWHNIQVKSLVSYLHDKLCNRYNLPLNHMSRGFTFEQRAWRLAQRTYNESEEAVGFPMMVYLIRNDLGQVI